MNDVKELLNELRADDQEAARNAEFIAYERKAQNLVLNREHEPSFRVVFNVTLKVWFSLLLLSIPTAFIVGIIYAAAQR
jgi:hypothetical protein